MKKVAKVIKEKPYDPAKIEFKWQKKWQSSKIYKTKEDNKKPKYYVLDMFPYPSGEGLHVGHPKGYIATDIISRYKRMKGFSVLHPMGFDAFGLPAENYALKTKTNPTDSVKKNVARYKKQLEILGFDYDWAREVNTTDPKYYKWTQWIFLKLLEKGLAYESYEPINWCPSCKTGLANEDVEDGKCERCGTVVEKKPMRQWVLKITDYAERLLMDLDIKKDSENLLDWPESIKILQKNWIGKSEGAIIKFKVQSAKLKVEEEIEVFTTRPDTLFGVTYVVLAPEHKLVNDFLTAVENKNEVEEYIKKVKNISEIERTDTKKEKTGVQLKGINVINPANNEVVPLWIADYVLPDYGTGAVMAVPAHDERDWEFAKKFGLNNRQVVAPYFENKTDLIPKTDKEIQERNNVHVVIFNPKNGKYLLQKWKNQGWQSFVTGGIESNENLIDCAKREVLEETGYKNIKHIQKLTDNWEVHSYFYAPHKDVNRYMKAKALYFELIDEEKDEVHSDDKDKYDIVWLDKNEVRDYLSHINQKINWDFIIDSTIYLEQGKLINSVKFNGKNSEEVKKEITESVGGKWVTKYKLRDWVFSRQRYWGEPIPVIHCENCKLVRPESNGIVPIPEKDLPVILPKVKSYEPTGTGESPLAAIAKWVNVKCPVCKSPAKRETNTMPQWAGSSWYYLRYIDPKNNKVLASKKTLDYWCGDKDDGVDLYVGGAEHATRHLIYARFWHKFLYDIGVVSNIEPFLKLQHVGLIMGEDGRKMSKRFLNVINPDEIAKNYGADSLRLYEMFMGPFDQQIAWSTSSISGVRRFIEKVWRLREKVTVFEKVESVDKIIHKTIKKVTEDIENMRYNTAISCMMIAINEIENAESISKDQYEIILKLLAPFAPHFTEELWVSLGNKKSIHLSSWPEFDPALIVNDEVNIMVQVNGKVRGSFTSSADADNATLETKAKEVDEVKKWLDGKKIIKVIVVPKRLVNFVVGE
jgi:leucyl-tRNA synthetase